jgi:tetratricopeptide (TPR) repeat protein
LAERYTRKEVGRILGVSQRQLHYWEKLRLVHPRARWGERFYSFHDLIAVDTIKRLTDRRVPARRLRRAVLALERLPGQPAALLSALRVLASGRQVAITPAGPVCQPFEPLTGQYVLAFENRPVTEKIHQMVSRSAEEWFEFALMCDAHVERLSESIVAYRRALELAPDWLEARINLGVALYKLCRLEESEQEFRAAVTLAPANAIAQFNLGCVLDEMGDHDGAIEHLRRAVEISPDHADAHFNLALAYEKRRQIRLAREHWSQYLRCEPNGPWADYARSRLASSQASGRPSKPIPFRKKG